MSGPLNKILVGLITCALTSVYMLEEVPARMDAQRVIEEKKTRKHKQAVLMEPSAYPDSYEQSKNKRVWDIMVEQMLRRKVIEKVDYRTLKQEKLK
jgi:hypothetical protein